MVNQSFQDETYLFDSADINLLYTFLKSQTCVNSSIVPQELSLCHPEQNLLAIYNYLTATYSLKEVHKS